jgi:hypothetical protein
MTNSQQDGYSRQPKRNEFKLHVSKDDVALKAEVHELIETHQFNNRDRLRTNFAALAELVRLGAEYDRQQTAGRAS